MRSHTIGRDSEQLAADYLAARGYRILARNFRDGPREIDIIASRDGSVVFAEVKARVAGGQTNPLETITWKKRRELAAAARAWLARNPGHGEQCQFDAVAVTWTPKGPVLDHIPNAWFVR